MHIIFLNFSYVIWKTNSLYSCSTWGRKVICCIFLNIILQVNFFSFLFSFLTDFFFLICWFSSWFLRHWSEPDRRRSLRLPPSTPEHEEDDDEGSLAAASLGERAEARARGGRSQRPLLRLCGRQSILLTCDWPELQTAARSSRSSCLMEARRVFITYRETNDVSLTLFSSEKE